MNIKRMISSGELDDPKGIINTKTLLEQAGRLLDKSCAEQIIGSVVFEDEEGKFHQVTVEAVISEVNIKDTTPSDCPDCLGEREWDEDSAGKTIARCMFCGTATPP